MNNIIEQQNKHYIECNVVMLSTENDLIGGEIFKLKNSLHATMTGAESRRAKHIGFIPHHLYITSNQPISVGDWFYRDTSIYKCIEVLDNDIVFMGKKNSVYGKRKVYWSKDLCKKIIATTDSELVTYTDYKGRPEVNEDKIVYTHNLPQIPQSFIKSYCDSNGSVDSVLVEVEPTCKCNNYLEHYFEQEEGKCKENTYQIKTNDKNEVIITPNKTSWSREEVIEILTNYCNEGMMENSTLIPISEWAKQNL